MSEREGAHREQASRVRRVSSGARWEPVVGYSRAVAAGDQVFVSGCTSIVDGSVVHEGDAYAQTVQAICNIEAALAALGCTLADVVRTRIFVTDMSRWQEYGRAHGELLGAAMPATSMVEVTRLIDPQLLVEVEAVAYRPGVGGRAERALSEREGSQRERGPATTVVRPEGRGPDRREERAP